MYLLMMSSDVMTKNSPYCLKMMLFYFLGLLSLEIAASESDHQKDHSSLIQSYDMAGSNNNSNNNNNNNVLDADDDLQGGILSRDYGKRFLESIASDIFKKNSGKRELDPLASEIFKKETGKRFLESIASDIFKKNTRYSSLPDIYFNEDSFPASKDMQKSDYLIGPDEYFQNVMANRKLHLNFREGPRREKIFKFNDTFGIPGPYYYYPSGHKRFLESIAGDIFKKDAGFGKRYLDGIASSLIKKDYDIDPEMDLYGVATGAQSGLTNKRYLDGIASSLIKKDDGEKRYLDGIASSLIKKDDGEKRYLDGIASSLIKKDDGEKRYLDGIASSLIKKDDGEKRYLDGIASSLIKKDDGEKRYLDGIASSLIKKDDGEKRYLDGIASSLIKKDDGKKRYLDGIASSLIKKDDGEKRYLDGIASSLIKRSSDSQSMSGAKRMYEVTDDVLDGSHISKRRADQTKEVMNSAPPPASVRRRRDISLISRQQSTLSRPRRFIDSLSSDIFKRRSFQGTHQDRPQVWSDTLTLVAPPATTKWTGQPDSSLDKIDVDEVAAKLFGDRRIFKKRYLDDIASSLLHKRYLDTVASSLIKRYDGDDTSGQAATGSYYRIPLYIQHPIDGTDSEIDRFDI